MIILRRGDRLPSVAAVQYFLNLYGNQQLAIDGDLGPITSEALREFQRENDLIVSGRVRNATWQKLNQRNRQIIDSVDATDDEITDYLDFQRYNGESIINYGMSLGVRNVINQIKSKSQGGKVVLLRFHGHGSPGHMIVSSGFDEDSGSSFDLDYAGNFWPLLGSLQSIFLPFGSIEFHGCNVAMGVRGERFLRRVANTLNVPATAGVRSQYGGGRDSLRFEGRTRTFCPNGIQLKDWALQVMSFSYL